MAQIVGEAEVSHCGASRGLCGERGDTRVLTVQYHSAGSRRSHMAEQFGRGVDFTESVKLIAHHVQQQCITGLDLLDEVDGVRLIELEHGDVRVQFAAERDFGKQCGDHAAHEVRAGRIGEHLQPQIGEHRGDHAGGGGLAVRAGHQYHAKRQLPERTGQEAGVNLFYDFAGQSRTAMFGDAGCKPHEAACGHGGERIPRFAGLHHGRLVLRNIA